MIPLNGTFFKKISRDLSSLCNTGPADMVVFSHARWEYGTQRPHHIVHRLAEDRRILFIEEPLAHNVSQRGQARVFQPSKGITVVQPFIRGDHLAEELEPILKAEMNRLGIKNAVLWLYSANFVDMLPLIKPKRLVVYDCMEVLVPDNPACIKRERSLLAQADVVFTDSMALYESKKQFSENVFYFPSSVDRKHFERALAKTTPVPELLATLERPVVGYYGVIDERIDMELLKAVSIALPRISFVMAGPMEKISSQTLPQAPNIYYLGQLTYEQLPAFLKGFDVSMLPFVLNISTELVRSEKIFESIAAGKPIVSTVMQDAVRNYKHVMSTVRTPEEFVNALYSYLYESALAKKRRRKAYEAVLNATSWDTTVWKMKKIIHAASEHRADLQGPIGSDWVASAAS